MLNITRSNFGLPMPLAIAATDTRAELKAIPVGARSDNLTFTLADGSTWRYSSTATAAEDTLQAFVLTPAGSPAAGRWLRVDYAFDLAIPITFANTDAQVLVTLPAGLELRVGRAYQNVTTAWTGGTSSAIGLSSSNASYNTKGDLAGGAAGDLTAALTIGKGRGAPGTKVASGSVVLVGGNNILFDRIASIYTAGAGTYVVPVSLIANPGA
jgi:hypothetical protein